MATNQQTVDEQVKVEVERFFRVFEQNAEARLRRLEDELRAAHARSHDPQGVPTASSGGSDGGASGATTGATNGTAAAASASSLTDTQPANTTAEYVAAAAQAGLSMWSSPGVLRGWGQAVPFIPAAVALLDNPATEDGKRLDTLTNQRFVLPAIIGGGLLLLARTVR